MSTEPFLESPRFARQQVIRWISTENELPHLSVKLGRPALPSQVQHGRVAASSFGAPANNDVVRDVFKCVALGLSLITNARSTTKKSIASISLPV